MELEVNKSHKKIDMSKIKKPLKRISAGALVSLCLFSGITAGKIYIDTVLEQPKTTITIEQREETVVNIPQAFKYNILFHLGKTENEDITASDLSNIKYLNLAIEEDVDLSFLNYCTNLEDLTITVLNENTINIINKMPTIPSLKSLTIYNMFLNIELNKDNALFLDNNPNIKYLEIDGITLVPGVEDNLSNLETLRLSHQENIDIDFGKLTNLKTLDLEELEPYTVAMHFNSEEYNTLKEHGVDIVFGLGKEELFLNANKKLDEIVNSLGVTKKSSDKEKLDAILLYVLSNLTYDEDIALLTQEELEQRDLTTEFYKEGLLYGALENEYAICGNYAALVEALSDRLGKPTDSYYMTSNEHAWNLMNIDNELYYVDSTWLENQIVLDSLNGINGIFSVKTPEEKIELGEGNDLDWYMENPSAYHIRNIDPTGAHIPNIQVPDYMNKEENSYQLDYELSKPKYLASNEKIKVKVNNEEKETSLGEIIGVMVGLGLAVSITQKKNEKLKEKNKEKNEPRKK